MTARPPWWQSDTYDVSSSVPLSFEGLAGPKGLALVKAWPDGRTDQGWGLIGPKGDEGNNFIRRYIRGEFNPRRVLYGYNLDKWNFAFVMRSVQLVCIDIDGKNGGFDGAKRLGLLPVTLAETSKSGNGFHLFYVNIEPWTHDKGFGQLADRIGIEQGVDVRAVGCVYHYPTQRWNHRPPAELPPHLKDLLLHREQKIAAATARIDSVLSSGDDMEVLMLHDEIMLDLAKPIPAGRRNNTLFAIGQQMREAKIEAWQDKLARRAHETGLDTDEVDKLVANIERYQP